jgi:hypothetical protein
VRNFRKRIGGFYTKAKFIPKIARNWNSGFEIRDYFGRKFIAKAVNSTFANEFWVKVSLLENYIYNFKKGVINERNN